MFFELEYQKNKQFDVGIFLNSSSKNVNDFVEFEFEKHQYEITCLNSDTKQHSWPLQLGAKHQLPLDTATPGKDNR